jgi:hypothetical protein
MLFDLFEISFDKLHTSQGSLMEQIRQVLSVGSENIKSRYIFRHVDIGIKEREK